MRSTVTTIVFDFLVAIRWDNFLDMISSFFYLLSFSKLLIIALEMKTEVKELKQPIPIKYKRMQMGRENVGLARNNVGDSKKGRKY